MSSIYRIPAAHFRGRAVLSNTAPTRPYRSAGRPEVMFVMERLIDLAAREFGFDRVELRRRNLLTRSGAALHEPFGMIYDSGDYHDTMEKALELGDWAGFPNARAEARKRGKCRGIGVANYVDTASGVPRERAEVTVHADGACRFVIGIVSNGQGHETSFAQLRERMAGRADRPCAPHRRRHRLREIRRRHALGPRHAHGEHRDLELLAGRSSGKAHASRRVLLECEPSTVRFNDGRFHSDGSGRRSASSMSRARRRRLSDLPDDLRGPLAAFSDETFNDASFPYGCHCCEVEVDPELGTVEIVRYAAVDDVGRAVNPLIIDGQIHGGIAQGVGQALLSTAITSLTSGQLLSGSFMDYAMPRADIFPSFTTHISEVPSTTHPLGIRPAGEGGTTPALGVVINAIVDALSEYGVKHVEMPATPERVWRAINESTWQLRRAEPR